MASKAHMLGHGNCPACNEESLREFEAINRLRAALKGLTQIGTTNGGGIIVGPQGWAQAQVAIEIRES